MQSFISETLDDILRETKTFENVTFVLPSQRAKVFVKQTFKDKISVGFLPEMLNIEQFIGQISEIKKVDTVQLLFHFYTIYKNSEKNPDSFEVFSSWAFKIVQDFNEIDQHLVDSNQIFIYLRDIERLRKWSVKGTFTETPLIKSHTAFLEKLQIYYTKFYDFLVQNKIGYQGIMYREACKKCDSYLSKNENRRYYFIGFNALNKAEEQLFQQVLETQPSQIYWDIDEAFLKINHQASYFIKKYKKEWKYYEKNSLKLLGNSFSNPKNIAVIGAAKNTTQIKYVGEILSKQTNFENTALILADETLLPIALNSIPKKCNAINITMGYPLKDIPITNMIVAIFEVFISQEKLQKKSSKEFYYKDVIRFFKHQNIYRFVPNLDDFLAKISKENQTFVHKDEILKLFNKALTEVQNAFSPIFEPITSVNNFLDRILDLINFIKEDVHPLEKEYLYRFYTILTQLQTLQNEFQYFTDIKTLLLFFKQLIASETLSFQGEPLKGLQIMGMLETRVLDFENIILVSTNEGILPANSQQHSFIPFDVKIEFGLPTYKEKDAIFSYHFFRLLQRAKNVSILYNTEHDVLGSGEKSRFVTQLEMMRNDIHQKIVAPKLITDKTPLKQVQKNKEILEALKEVAVKGISPSALTTYLHNPMSFYKQKVLKLKEMEEVEETVAFNTLGTIVHETLDELYQPFVGKYLTSLSVDEMSKKAKLLVAKHFKKEFKNGDISTGRNRLIFEVANRFVVNFLKKEKELVANDSNTLKILATEETLSTTINVEGINFPIKIHGQVDRVDELNGVLRIIDYKTGLVESGNLRVPDFENLRDDKHLKAIQVLLYAYLYTQTKKCDDQQSIEAGIYSFKNLKSGFIPINFAATRKPPITAITPEKLDAFIEEIKVYIKEIFDEAVDFLEPADAKY